MRRGGERWRTVGDDGACLGRDLELLRGVLEHRGEGRGLRHAEPAGIQSGRVGSITDQEQQQTATAIDRSRGRGIRSEGGREKALMVLTL